MASMLQNMTRLGVLPQIERLEPHAPVKKAEQDQSPAPIHIDALFVSTGLSVLTPPGLGSEIQDYEYKGTIHRKLDPLYFAWLRSRMLLARDAFHAGNLSASKWELMRGIFNAIQEWALERFGPTELSKGETMLKTCNYIPPTSPIPSETTKREM